MQIVGVQSEALVFNAAESTTAHITRTNSQIVKIIIDFVNSGDFTSWATIRKPEEIFAPALSIVKCFISQSLDYNIPQNFQWFSQFKHFEELEEYIEMTNDIELRTANKIASEHGERLLNTLYLAQNQFGNKAAKSFLTTAHTSKGLEWENVIIHQDFGSIIDKIAQQFTSLKSYLSAVKSPAKNKIDEEINLLYVATTRTKSSCVALFQDADMILDSFDSYTDDEISRRHEVFMQAKKLKASLGM